MAQYEAIPCEFPPGQCLPQRVWADQWFPTATVAGVRLGYGGEHYVNAYDGRRQRLTGGDWVVTDESGHVTVWRDDNFRHHFRLVEG